MSKWYLNKKYTPIVNILSDNYDGVYSDWLENQPEQYQGHYSSTELSAFNANNPCIWAISNCQSMNIMGRYFIQNYGMIKYCGDIIVMICVKTEEVFTIKDKEERKKFCLDSNNWTAFERLYPNSTVNKQVRRVTKIMLPLLGCNNESKIVELSYEDFDTFFEPYYNISSDLFSKENQKRISAQFLAEFQSEVSDNVVVEELFS